jgi:anti-anti-sigma regulatory factor
MNSSRPRESTLPITVTAMTTATELWVRIIGEADLSNRDDLQSALSAIDYRAARGVRLDLRRLTFCDCAACLVILEFERGARLSGHPTEISVSNPTLRKVVEFLTRECWPAEAAPFLHMEADSLG